MFALKQVIPHVYALTFDDGYDLALHFWRVQEFYESPRFRGQQFTLVEYMEWYAKEGSGKEHGCFSYPDDWKGFNIPGEMLERVYFRSSIPDENQYDAFMREVTRMIRAREAGSYYVIGAKTGSEETMRHEIAHGLFHTNKNYHRRALDLIGGLGAQLSFGLREALHDQGYHLEVLSDETQAYLSAGLIERLEKVFRELKLNPEEVRAPFVKLLNEFYSER